MPDAELSTTHGENRIARLEDLVERRLAAVAEQSGNWTATQIKEFVESILVEKDRALAMADQEREKAASALRGEQQRALDQAERERSKAADNLKVELARAISEGDARLAEHITNQVHQIREALSSADRLELARVASADARTDAVAREVLLVHEASERAIAKAEVSTNKSFKDANEWRQQSADRERVQQENIASLARTLASREFVDTSLDKQNTVAERNQRDIAQINERLNVSQGEKEGARVTKGEMVTALTVAASAIGAVVVVANVVAGG